MVRVQCPYCKRTYRTQLEAFGVTAVCTRCHEPFRIGESRPPFSYKPSDLAEDSWIGVEPPKPKPELKHCLLCEAPLPTGATHCPACGANVVTGVVHKMRSTTEPEHIPLRARLPLKTLLLVLVLGGLGAAAYWGFRSLSRSAAELGDELMLQAVTARAVARAREGADVGTLAEEFTGQVTDENLTHFVRMLSATDPAVRLAATGLIGGGDITDLEAILRLVDEGREDVARDVLDAIGLRRLAVLSGGQSAARREAAARAIGVLVGLKLSPADAARLAAPMSADEKIALVNTRVGPVPAATGDFVLVIEQRTSPFLVRVDQMGRTFEMRIGSRTFRTSWREPRNLNIPIERWCTATGTAVDAAAVRDLLDGAVTLSSPVGGPWEGMLRVRARRKIVGPLPGFLPVPAPDPGRTLRVPVYLERARR